MHNEVSLCMIVKNEEESLPACLNSIKDIIDEIIIVDTGSTDRTIEIAKSFGAKVYFYQWNNNFSKARNESLKYATKEWIFIMDGDDELYPEYRENLKTLLSGPLDEKAIYYFETLNYYGSKIDINNVTVNLNPRLFKNNRGIHYEGEIHNQLTTTQNEYNAVCNEIKIHHYGYLDKTIKSKNKRERNIPILINQVTNNPNNKFAYFNLGNEYSALMDMRKALECYYKAFENFDPNKGYSCMLLVRITSTNYYIGEYNEALKFTNIGEEYFPKCTDFYYYRALIFRAMNRPTLEIKALEKCIQLGEPPSELKFIDGTGSFRAYYELGNVYFRLKDSDTAYNYYIEAIKSKSDFIDPLYNIGKILNETNITIDEFKITIENFFSDYPNSYIIIADIFYDIGYYDTTLDYLKKCELSEIVSESVMILKEKCLIRIGAFDDCINMNCLNENSSSYLYFSMYKVLSGILTNRYDYALTVLSGFTEDVLTDNDKKLIKVYCQLLNLFTEKTTTMLSEDENNNEYIPFILDILEILIINKKFDELKTAVNLLNLINNRYALLYLGKLYNKLGYVDISRKEILRSIKEFEIYDNESLNILSN